jgi:Kef-type K+ transport system membrane component KefB
MPNELSFVMQSAAWPLVMLVAWFLGEWMATHAWHIPRVSVYVAVGTVVGLGNLPGLTDELVGLRFVAHVALALVLFELGCRINLRWFRHNPWVLVSGLFESALTFGLVWAIVQSFTDRVHVQFAVAALAVATSPVGILRVTHELRSAGQVTERLLHLSAINCLVSLFALNLVMGSRAFRVSGDWLQASFSSIYVLGTSVALGMLMGLVVTQLLRIRSSQGPEHVTMVFALSTLLLTTLTYGLKLSPMLAALTFGMVVRERRVYLANANRNFGSLGNLLAVFLFVYMAALIEWDDVINSWQLGLGILAGRGLSKLAVNALVAKVSGITLQKGVLTGVALSPMSAFVVLLVDHGGTIGFDRAAQTLGAMGFCILVLELMGPILTQRALILARESNIRIDK